MGLSDRVAAAALDALAPHIAVLDDEGTVVGTNASWQRFGAENSPVAPGSGEGENYLSVCDGAGGDEHAQEAAAGIRALLDGDRDRFEMEYPCHSPDRKAWFLLTATRFVVDGDRYVVTAHTDITERKVAELEMERQKETTEAFASMLNHDMRTPLSVAMGRVELAAEETGDENLDPAMDALDRMEEMLTNGVSYLRLGHEAVDRETVSLADAARESWDTVDASAATLDVTGDRQLSAYPPLLAHLFENLFDNAVAFGGEEVTVAVGPTDEGFYVADDGPGVPPGDREDLFELGHSTRPGGGHGFGLAIVQAIVDVHGWDVAYAESESGGARFDVEVAPTRPSPTILDRETD